jgi:hypothetical protein
MEHMKTFLRLDSGEAFCVGAGAGLGKRARARLWIWMCFWVGFLFECAIRYQ